jgi:hypothetical protein
MALSIILVLAALLVCALLFIALSFRHDLSARGVLFKTLSRFGMRPAYLRTPEPSTPYRRLKDTAGVLHRPLLLNLETSDGSGEVTHPDVAYIREGFGEGKWTYWMACTPYPDRNDRYENPEIFVSDNGINWAVPRGLTNPVVPTPETLGDHHSDPDILFHLNYLWLFYRQTMRSKNPSENRIFLMKSTDGVRWSVPVEVLSDNTGRLLLSPAVIQTGHRFLMWTVEIGDGGCALVRRSSQNGLEWSEPELCKLAGLVAPRHAWHIDVVQESDRLSALLVSCMGHGGAHSRIHYAYSEDQGLNWSTEGFLFDQVYEFEAGVQYRGSLLPRNGRPGEYDLWYSAASGRLRCSIAHLRLTRDHHRMWPSQGDTETLQKTAAGLSHL